MKLFAILLAFALSGCAALDTYKAGAANKAAGAMDGLRVDAEWTLCRAISVGAWLRAYGTVPAKAAAWRELCAEPVTEDPAGAAVQP